MTYWLIALALIIGCSIIGHAIIAFGEMHTKAIENAVLRLELLVYSVQAEEGEE